MLRGYDRRHCATRATRSLFFVYSVLCVICRGKKTLEKTLEYRTVLVVVPVLSLKIALHSSTYVECSFDANAFEVSVDGINKRLQHI
jgi:hypothetical protein